MVERRSGFLLGWILLIFRWASFAVSFREGTPRKVNEWFTWKSATGNGDSELGNHHLFSFRSFNFGAVTCRPEKRYHFKRERQMSSGATTWTTLWYRKKCSKVVLVQILGEWYAFLFSTMKRTLFFGNLVLEGFYCFARKRYDHASF